MRAKDTAASTPRPRLRLGYIAGNCRPTTGEDMIGPKQVSRDSATTGMFSPENI